MSNTVSVRVCLFMSTLFLLQSCRTFCAGDSETVKMVCLVCVSSIKGYSVQNLAWQIPLVDHLGCSDYE